MTKKATSVVEKTLTPATGNKHDYLSLSPYYWPDPTKPNGLPYIIHDGIVNPTSLFRSRQTEPRGHDSQGKDTITRLLFYG